MSNPLEARAVKLLADTEATIQAQPSQSVRAILIEAVTFLGDAVELIRAGKSDEAINTLSDARNELNRLGGAYRAGLLERVERLQLALINA